MPIEKFIKIQSSAVPVQIENVDTDQIIPARFLKAVERKGFGDNLFRDWRYDKSNNPISDFPLNDIKYSGQILIGGKNGIRYWIGILKRPKSVGSKMLS